MVGTKQGNEGAKFYFSYFGEISCQKTPLIQIWKVWKKFSFHIMVF